VLGTGNGRGVLVVGAADDRGTGTPGPQAAALFDARSPLTVLPLAGLALPYEDGEIDECHVLAPVAGLNARLRDAVLREAERVAVKVSSSVREEAR
jgi:hypothetical protein